MNGIRTTGVGVALALAAAPGVAQSPAPAAPAATLGRVTATDAAPSGPVVRAAAPDARPTALFPSPAFRTQAGQPGGSTPLPPGKPVEGQPNVTESRTPPGTQPFVPGTQPFVPGTHYPPPTMVPGTYQPGTHYPPPTMVPGTYQPPTYTYPAPAYAAPAPAVTGPVVGGSMTGCDPYSGAGSLATPVSPSAPAVVGDGGYFAAPQPQQPYWANGWDPLFPRARQAVGSVLNPSGQGRLVLGGEYLLWFARSQRLPPLVTTSSPAFNGILGQGDTQVIYGAGTAATRTTHNGARFSGTYWLNDTWGIDGNVWFLARNTGGFSATTDQYPLLARPFFNVNTGANFSELVAAPGLATGSVVVNNQTGMWGNEINLRRALLCFPCARVDALIGFRNMNLREETNITETFARTPGSNTGVGVANVTSGVVQDRFRTANNFYGLNLGLAGEVRRGWWYMSGKVGVGLGTVYQQADISGYQYLNTPTGGIVNQGGLLALPGANFGTFRQAKFGVMPDAGLTVGVYVTPNLRLGVGYNLIYLNSVVRPAEQMDLGLDVTRIPNFPVGTVPAAAGVRPSAYPLKTTDFFVQGITFSLMWSF